MVTTHNLGFPRMGSQRELKFATEAFWKKEISREKLESTCKKIRENNWLMQSNAGLDLIPVGDFSLYDHVLDMSVMLGVIPKRFAGQDDISTYFSMARGSSSAHACEMTKWFNTNYHYIVPEFELNQSFSTNPKKLNDEINEALRLNYKLKPTILGPLSYLWLGKMSGGKHDKLSLLPDLIEAYKEILTSLQRNKISWVQIDEPILVLDLPEEWRAAFKQAYQQMQTPELNILLVTYFGSIERNLPLVADLPVAGLHVDAVFSTQSVDTIVNHLQPSQILSLGIVNGRNIWRTDLNKTIEFLKPIHEKLGDRLWLAGSCSLLHVPVDVELEDKLNPELKSWLSFAKQKVRETVVLAKALGNDSDSITDELSNNKQAMATRTTSALIHNPQVKQRCDAVTNDQYERNNQYPQRSIVQQKFLNLKLLPTTTIGSFPQTSNIRKLRREFKSGAISSVDYKISLKKHIQSTISEQEQIGLDVLVHGEPERSDMVEYFAELMDGFALMQHGWVQSYGSRYVKPPIIYGDVSCSQPMTVEWITYAQSLTKNMVKGMLTGPVTILHWSFMRDDIPISESAEQIALVLRDEVSALEKSGIKIIQIDEPAFREGLPLRKQDWPAYLTWATQCFKLASACAKDETQIHTHMCYAEFNDIIDSIASLDADVISMETSRSQMELLEVFKEFKYPNEIGPGVYDVHSPRVPTVEDIISLINRAACFIPVERVWINPDCGLKTRMWPEVKAALANMTEAAKQLREQHKKASI